MSLKLSSRQVGDVTVVDAAGRITLGEGSSAFRDMIKDLITKGSRKVLPNLGEITYMYTVFEVFDDEAAGLSSFK